MKYKYKIYDKRTKELLVEGTRDEVADYLNVTSATVQMHYLDRDNKLMYSNCPWRVEREPNVD